MPQPEFAVFSPPPASAVGWPAIHSALQHLAAAMPLGKGIRILSSLNQQHGIDCPGCAWPDPKRRSKLGEFCENGVKAIAEEAMSRHADPAFFARYSVEELRGMSDYWLGQQGRLTHPMVLEPGDTHYRPVAWAEAFSRIGQALRGLASPHEAVFYTSGRTSNEAAFLYQLFVRLYGTNNLPDCSNMCHESSGKALSETLGIGKGSVTLEDFDQAELILIFGQNPATNHPRMLTSLERAKANGAKIVAVNPLREAGLLHFKNPQTPKGLLGGGTPLADLYLQVRINEDVALLKAAMIRLLERARQSPDVLDHDFIGGKTEGFQALRDDLARYRWGDLVARTGLPPAEVEAFADLLASRRRIIACWAMGLTQHRNAVDNIREVVNLLLLKGSIGKPGAGTCPVRGHSNVQGDRTMGIAERPSKALLDRLAARFGFEPPREHGYSVIEAIEAMHEGKAKVMVALGGNFAAAAPDTPYTEEALRRCALTVQVSTKLNRSHLAPGRTAFILPCLGRTDRHEVGGKEQVITVENSMGVVHTSAGALRPPSRHLLAEPSIVAGIAQEALAQSPVDWQALAADYRLIRDLIEQTVEGFERFNERIREANGFELPNGPRQGIFHTPTGKAQFTVNALPETALEEGEYLMMTVRSHDQFNTTVYGLNDRYRGVFNGRMVVFMHAADAAREGLADGDTVALHNCYGGVARRVEGFRVRCYDLPAGCVATYFPEANPLVPLGEFAHTSLTPASKSVKVRIEKGPSQ
jgi:molybdopterin-dependent oxidoreductase alpha subunit